MKYEWIDIKAYESWKSLKQHVEEMLTIPDTAQQYFKIFFNNADHQHNSLRITASSAGEGLDQGIGH